MVGTEVGQRLEHHSGFLREKALIHWITTQTSIATAAMQGGSQQPGFIQASDVGNRKPIIF